MTLSGVACCHTEGLNGEDMRAMHGNNTMNRPCKLNILQITIGVMHLVMHHFGNW